MVLLIVALLLLTGIIDSVANVDGLMPSIVAWESELEKLSVLDQLSGFSSPVLREPFKSSVQYFVHRWNCQDTSSLLGGIAKPYDGDIKPWPEQGYTPLWFNDVDGSDLGSREDYRGSWCFVRSECPIISEPASDGKRYMKTDSLLSRADTFGCAVKYLRVNGKEIFGAGPSRLTWMRELRSLGVTESIVAYLSHSVNGTPNDQDLDGLCEYSSMSEGRAAVAHELGMGTVTNKNNAIYGDPCSMVVVDVAYSVKYTSLVTIMNVIFLVMLLSYSDSTINRSILLLVVQPISEMVAMVQGLAENPMMKLTTAELPGASTETRLVANALVKLSAMLQIAFGEAGAHIIAHNIQSVDNINALVPGRRVRGIFGFCDVRRFTDCTECFLADVLVFMNRIADYAHTSVTDNLGHATMNLGDAFQFAWILQEGNYGMKGESASDAKAQFADAALRSLLRVVVEIATDQYLITMSSNEELQRRVPGYVASAGFGLHCGWAIQGAIGSEEKIDAIYMSSHVKWAERLEGATKYYGVMILMTGSFFDLLSSEVQARCRRVDRIKVADNPNPIDLYTYDITPFSLVYIDGVNSRSGLEDVNGFFDAFPPSNSLEWRISYQIALNNFLDGEWEAALACLDECLMVHPDDGPSKALKAYMEKYEFSVPFGWKGYRECTDI